MDVKLSTANAPSSAGRVFFLIAFILVCLNLRCSFTAADSLLRRIEEDLHLSLEGSGAFALLPVFVLGVAAPLAPRLSRVVAPGRLVFWALIVAVAGILWRSYGQTAGLYGGMIVMGLGLGVGGAVIPGLVKREFPAHQSLMMGMYSALVGLGSSLGAAGAIPAARLLGDWNDGLAVWALPLLVAACVWLSYFIVHSSVSGKTLNTRFSRLLSNGDAWDVTVFYMFRVAGAYFIFTWLPTLMVGRGMRPEDAGFLLSLATLVQIPAAMTAHWLTDRMGGHGRAVVVSFLLSCLCCWGFLFAPLAYVIPLGVVFGFSIGVLFSRGMALMVERAKDEVSSVELSGMSQGFGFTLGALLALGGSSFVHPGGSPWMFCLIYTLFCLVGLIFGKRSSRPVQI